MLPTAQLDSSAREKRECNLSSEKRRVADWAQWYCWLIWLIEQQQQRKNLWNTQVNFRFPCASPRTKWFLGCKVFACLLLLLLLVVVGDQWLGRTEHSQLVDCTMADYHFLLSPQVASLPHFLPHSLDFYLQASDCWKVRGRECRR